MKDSTTTVTTTTCSDTQPSQVNTCRFSSSGGSKGAPLNFMQFLGKNRQNRMLAPPGRLAPPLTGNAGSPPSRLLSWWHRGNTFTSHRYGLGLTLIPGHMWDVFHPSQLMPGGFPLGVFFHPQKGSKLFRFQLELSHKAHRPGQNLFWVT